LNVRTVDGDVGWVAAAYVRDLDSSGLADAISTIADHDAAGTAGVTDATGRRTADGSQSSLAQGQMPAFVTQSDSMGGQPADPADPYQPASVSSDVNDGAISLPAS